MLIRAGAKECEPTLRMQKKLQQGGTVGSLQNSAPGAPSAPAEGQKAVAADGPPALTGAAAAIPAAAAIGLPNRRASAEEEKTVDDMPERRGSEARCVSVGRVFVGGQEASIEALAQGMEF